MTNIAAQEGGTITVVGTYGYMPPEQFGGRTKPASDLYSLGATLIYLVTGMHPTELPQQDLQIQFRQITNLSPELTDWLEWMTEPSLEQRFASVEIAIQNIESPPIRENAIQTSNQQATKPPRSRIQLIKSPEKLEIILPPKGFDIGLVILISCVAPLALGLNFFNFNFSYVQPVNNQVIWIVSQGCAIAYLIFLILSGFYKRLRVKIDRKNIVITHELLGLKWHLGKPTSTSLIRRIDLAQSLTDIEVTPWLKLIVKDFNSAKFNFDRHTNLSDDERQWLAEELSDWLEIPINEYPEYYDKYLNQSQ